jgi:adenine deaminase
VLVSFNSDDSDLARRLYLEAAKAVKYGGTPEEEALKFVTINPARQLRIDNSIGSLEQGKDGDFVVWSKSPLDSGTVCLETWIEGKKYFDRTMNEQRASDRDKEWHALIDKAKRSSKPSGSTEPKSDSTRANFFDVALEHQYDLVRRHCDDK